MHKNACIRQNNIAPGKLHINMHTMGEIHTKIMMNFQVDGFHFLKKCKVMPKFGKWNLQLVQ